MDRRRVWIPACAAAWVAIGVYANTFGHAFVVDDIPQVKENPWLSGADQLPDIFTKGVWDFEGRVSSYYRPFMYVVYLATAEVAGRNPVAFHLVNVLFHALASALAAVAAGGVAGALDRGGVATRWAPWLVGIGFAVHPIHTEAVAWVAGMADLGFGVCALAALSAYVASDGGRRFDFLAAAAYLGAMLFKEPAVLLPLVLLSVDLMRERAGGGWRRLALRMSPFGVALAIYLALRVHALGGLAPTASDLGLSQSAFARAVVTLAGRYLFALAWPFPQNFWHAFEVPASWSRSDVVLALGVLGAYSGLLWRFRKHRLACWGLIAIVPPLLPALALRGLNQGLENAFAERYLYVPSFGFLIAVTAAAASLASRSGRAARGVAGAVLVLAVAAAGATVQRNAVWRDHLHLWTDAAAKSPDSGVAQQSLGFALLAAGRGDEAQVHLRRALELRADLPALAREKAEHYERVGLPKKAIFSYLTTLTLDPGDIRARWGLARQYAVLGWRPNAEAEYRRVIAADPALADARNELGILLAERGDLPAALEEFERARAIRPDDPDFAVNADRTRRLIRERR